MFQPTTNIQMSQANESLIAAELFDESAQNMMINQLLNALNDGVESSGPTSSAHMNPEERLAAAIANSPTG